MRHVLIARSKRKFQGSGAIGTAPPAASVAVGSLWADGAVVYQNKNTFRNSGADSVSLGRPTALINLLDLGSSYTVQVISKQVVEGAGALVALGRAGATSRYLYLGKRAIIVAGLGSQIGGGGTLVHSGGSSLNKYFKQSISKTTTSDFFVVDNGSKSSNGTAGINVNNTDPITISALADGADNIEAYFYKVSFYQGFNADGSVTGLTLIDEVDFSNPDQWDGGLSGTTWAGNPFTITDGSPTGVRVQDWVPINL